MPLLLLFDLIDLMLVLKILDHGLLLLLELELVLEHELSVGLLLHGPEVFLLSFHFLRMSGVSHLLGLLRFYVVDLIRTQTFEMVGQESVLAQPVCGRLSCLSHKVRSGGVCYFLSVLPLLRSSLRCLLVPLGLGL